MPPPADPTLAALSRAIEPPAGWQPPTRFERLFPYQQAAVAQAPLRRHLLLAHAPGLGKTPMALALLRGSTLIVCPPTIVQQWAARMLEWTGAMPTILVTGRAIGAMRRLRDVTIIPDSLIHQLTPDAEVDVLVVDEVHRLKTRETRRTRSVFTRNEETGKPGIAHRAARVIGLTGTPLQNTPVDLYPLLSVCAPQVAPSFKAYTERYCPPVMVNMPGSPYPRARYDLKMQNLDELALKLRESVMIRPPTSECQAQLPPLLEDVYHLTITDPAAGVTAEQVMAAFDGSAPVTEAEQLAIATARKATGLAKAHATALTSWLADLIEGGDRPLLWCWHQEVAAYLASKLNIGLIHGGVPLAQRPGLVAAYQRGDLNGLAITIGAAGTGLDGLQHGGQLAVFIEEHYNPGDNDQAVARLHRVGQTRGVRIIRVRTSTVVDRGIEAILRRKTAMIRTTLA